MSSLAKVREALERIAGGECFFKGMPGDSCAGAGTSPPCHVCIAREALVSLASLLPLETDGPRFRSGRQVMEHYRASAKPSAGESRISRSPSDLAALADAPELLKPSPPSNTWGLRWPNGTTAALPDEESARRCFAVLQGRPPGLSEDFHGLHAAATKLLSSAIQEIEPDTRLEGHEERFRLRVQEMAELLRPLGSMAEVKAVDAEKPKGEPREEDGQASRQAVAQEKGEHRDG